MADSTNNVSGRKGESSDNSSDSGTKKRILVTKSVDKMIQDYDKQFNTMIWLKYMYKVVDCTHVESLSCSACTKLII